MRAILSSVQICLLLCPVSGIGQATRLSPQSVEWRRHDMRHLPPAPDTTGPLSVFGEHTRFEFYSVRDGRVRRSVLLRINNARGSDDLGNFSLPESFNEGYDATAYFPAAYSGPPVPYIMEYKAIQFCVRRYSGGRWTEIPLTTRYESFTRIRGGGDIIKDQRQLFFIPALRVGDTLELYYEAVFVSSYGSNLFFLPGRSAKAVCDYEFRYRVERGQAGSQNSLPLYIPDSCIVTEIEKHPDYSVVTKTIRMTNLQRVNYPANSFAAGRLPHVFVDFNNHRLIRKSYPSAGGRKYEIDSMRPPNFQWMIRVDTHSVYKVYDKQHALITAFLRPFPKPVDDTSTYRFLKTISDTINEFRYLSDARLMNEERDLWEVRSGDHLLKRHVVDGQVKKVYEDLLNGSGVFYFDVNVLDNRFANQNERYRAHYAYENWLLAVPTAQSMMFLAPRRGGQRYFVNELPFYLENAPAMLTGRNFQNSRQRAEPVKFTRTPASTWRDNLRVESAVVKVNTGEGKAVFQIKETISGQFSTLLRPLYSGHMIDSSVSRHYFKRCVDKPMASQVALRCTAASPEFPYRHSYIASEELTLPSDSAIHIGGWFSFITGGTQLPEEPRYDYYFDFPFSDSYYYSLEFGQQVEIINREAFKKNLSNEMFQLQSDIVPAGPGKFLVHVKVNVIRRHIPVSESGRLMEFVNALDDLKSFVALVGKKGAGNLSHEAD